MTSDILSLSFDEFLTVSQTQKKQTVEGRLWRTYKALAATESNVYLFNTLKKQGLATNDVRHFVEKQTTNKKVKVFADNRVKKSAMQSKLTDALAYAKRLRQDKNLYKNKVSTKYRNSVAKGRRVMDEIYKRYLSLRESQMETAKKKVKWYREREVMTKSIIEAPDNVKDLLSGVNIFNEDQEKLQPEEPLGPFICDPKITFSKDELAILARGPKFMVRSELDKEDFKVECEKMIAKKKYDSVFNGVDDNEDDIPKVTGLHGSAVKPQNSAVCDGGNKSDLSLKNVDQKWEENVGNMPYDCKSKMLDLGNLRASSYKYNKEIFLPQPETPDIETGHEIRRVEMLRVFDRVTKSSDGPIDKNKQQSNTNVSFDSNLSKSELAGLRSLKKNELKKGL